MQKFTAEQLTNEHIIPEAIHGTWVLEKGSCQSCARFSNTAYENDALNTDLKIARYLLGLRGKRGAVKPDLRHLPAVYRGNGIFGAGPEDRLTDFPAGEYPRAFCLLWFRPPGLLSGVDRGSTLNPLGLTTFSLNRKGLNNVTVRHPFKNGPFALMLAKIAYCYAVAEKGYEAFDGEPIRSLLRGERSDVYNFVGSAAQAERLTNRDLHALYFRRRGPWLTVLVHLFASLPQAPMATRPYEVVVGAAL